jgi:hypothetical protein
MGKSNRQSPSPRSAEECLGSTLKTAASLAKAAEVTAALLPQVLLALQGIQRQLEIQSFVKVHGVRLPLDPKLQRLLSPDADATQEPTIPPA